MNLRLRQVITIVVGVLLAGVMLLLGLWQMSSFQRSVSDIASERAAAPPLPLAQNIHDDGTIEDIYGRQVQFSGQVVPGHDLLVGSEWPMRVVVPFEMSDGDVVALILGLSDHPVAVTDAAPLDATGIFTAGDQAGDLTPPPDAPEGSMATLRLQELVQQWPQPMIAGYVTLNEEGAARFGLTPATAELPEVPGSTMHQGYALQWWVFAAASIIFSIIVARGFKPRDEEVDAPRT